jgi:hypothetical protein
MIASAVVREYGPKIGAIPLAVYVVLSEHADKHGRCFPSYKKIGEMVNISRRQAIRAVHTLVEHGLVEVEYRRDDETMRAQSNVFLLPKCVVPSDAPSLGSEPVSPPLVNVSHHPSDTPSPITIPREPDAKEPSPPSPPTRPTYADSLNGDYRKVVETFKKFHPDFSEGWLRHTLALVEGEVGPLAGDLVLDAIGGTLRDLDAAFKAERRGKMEVHSPRRYAQALLTNRMKEQRA